MIALLLTPVAVAQVSPRPAKTTHAVVIADVLKVGRPKGLSCVNTAESICITGVPDGAWLNVRKVWLGKLTIGRLPVFSAAPVQLKPGRHALILEGTGPDWIVMAARRGSKPCFAEEAISPDDDLYPHVKPVGGDYCIVAH